MKTKLQKAATAKDREKKFLDGLVKSLEDFADEVESGNETAEITDDRTPQNRRHLANIIKKRAWKEMPWGYLESKPVFEKNIVERLWRIAHKKA
jgi:hypothetical protein